MLDVPLPRVWAALNDPNVLKLCVPGCQEINVVGPNIYSAKAVIKIGFISSRFDNVLVKKSVAEDGQSLNFEMSGEDTNKIGSFKQKLQIKLSDSTSPSSNSAKTTIELNADVELKGKFATLGKRIVEWKAKNVMEEFVQNLRKLS